MVALREPTPTLAAESTGGRDPTAAGMFHSTPPVASTDLGLRRQWYQAGRKVREGRFHATFKHVRTATDYQPRQLQTLLRDKEKRRLANGEESGDRLGPSDDRSTEPNYAEESNQIGTVRKERVFESEVTESEMDIIQKRIALQQRQFAEFERREFNRKARKIRTMFDYLADEEIKFTLEQFRNNEDEVITKFSHPGYLFTVRKELARTCVPPARVTVMNEEQRTAYELLLRKRTSTLKKSTTEDARHKYRTCKRLALDDALKQLQSNKVDLEKAMEGWSAARVKAFQAIDTKPNTYYYRFNAPGEEQRTGGWTDEEKRLFHKRLNEIGANGQWGIFSMAIPGRVGYQCSNYYRHLIETRQILDPNYVLDDKGKAHYLFTTKEVNKDGSAVKTFRTHKKKHTYGGGPSDDDNARSSVEPPESKRRTVRHRQTRVGGVVVGEGTTLTVAAEGAIAPIAVVRPPSSSTTTGSIATGFSTTTASGAVSSKRKRRNYKTYESNDDEDEDEHAFADDSDDGDFTSGPKSTWNTTRRTRGRAEADPTPVNSSSQNTTIQNGSGAMKVDAAVNSGTGGGDSGLSFMSLMQQGLQGLNSSDLADLMDEDDDDEFHDPENPLPGFTDPITLDPVVKPAISPYGHVMGYDNWVRCLTTGDNRNTCPLTKKPLSKRDLVVLTHDNIEEYRDRIVNQ